MQSRDGVRAVIDGRNFTEMAVMQFVLFESDDGGTARRRPAKNAAEKYIFALLEDRR
jgi:hypothetical protein